MIEVNYNDYKEILEENMKLIVENHNQKETYKHLKELYEVALKDYDEVTKRIDKAVEYIDNYINQFNGVYPIADMRYLDLHKLLEILDKEGKQCTNY